MEGNQNIVVIISPTGKVNVEANGFNGVGCTEATEQIEIVLGNKTTREHKPEYHTPAAESLAETLKDDF